MLHSRKETALIERTQQDVRKLKAYARFVILLRNDDAVEVIDNKGRKNQKLPCAEIIGVLGESLVGGVRLKESLLMEVAYRRARPYAEIEKKFLDTKGKEREPRWRITPRRQVRKLFEKEFGVVYPHVIKCMATIVLEQRAGWKCKGRWWVNGPGPTDRGIHFTIAEHDECMFRQMVQEDVRYRKRRYLAGHAKRVRRLLRNYSSSYYTAKQLRSFARARKVAELLSQESYTPWYRAILCGSFAVGSHERLLLDAIIEAFHLDVSLSDRDEQLLDSFTTKFPRLETLECHRPQQQPNGHTYGGHARGASVFEMLLQKEFQRAEEIPF